MLGKFILEILTKLFYTFMLDLSSQVTGWGQDAFGGELQARLQEVISVFSFQVEQRWVVTKCPKLY